MTEMESVEVGGQVLTYREPRRPCPVHRAPCFADMLRDPENPRRWRLSWFCPDCWAWYDEAHFAAYLCGPRDGVALRCPRCGVTAVVHDCDPGCCNEHVCLECGAPLLVTTAVAVPGGPRREREPAVIPTGWRTERHRCGKRHAMELAWEHTWAAWRCPECDMAPRDLPDHRGEWRPDLELYGVDALRCGAPVRRAPAAETQCAACGAFLSGVAPRVTCGECGAVNEVSATIGDFRPMHGPRGASRRRPAIRRRQARAGGGEG